MTRFPELSVVADAREANDRAKTEALLGLIRPRLRAPLRRALVVGCGSGQEAGVLARTLGAETCGIDIGAEFAFDHDAARPATLRTMDAQALEFEDGAFDLVYSFHALEHIPNFRQALREMSRVLRPGGTFCLGTPNRARIVAYVGASVSLGTKLYWNACDAWMRVRGRWSNERGAHAGFYAEELLKHCHESFGEAADITDEYYLSLYSNRQSVVRALSATRMKRRLFPCVYVIGCKLDRTSAPARGVRTTPAEGGSHAAIRATA